MVTALRFDLRTKQISQFTFANPATVMSGVGTAAGAGAVSGVASGAGAARGAGASSARAAVVGVGLATGTIDVVGTSQGEALVFGRAINNVTTSAAGASSGAASGAAVGLAYALKTAAGTSAGVATVNGASAAAVTEQPDSMGDKVVLLLKGDSVNGASAFVDSSANNIPVYASGGAVHTASGRFDGGLDSTAGGSVIVIGNNGNPTTFSTGAPAPIRGLFASTSEWTIEGWAKSPTSGGALFEADNGGGSNNALGFNPHSGKLGPYSLRNGALNQGSGANGPAFGVWFHFAFVKTRADGKLKCYVNGANIASTAGGFDYLTSPAAFPDTAIIRIGAGDWILDEVRVTAAARYTSSFAVPDAPFESGVGSSTAISGNDPLWDKVALYAPMSLADGSAPVDVSRNKLAITANGNAPILENSTVIYYPGGFTTPPPVVSYGSLRMDRGGRDALTGALDPYANRVSNATIGSGIIPSPLRLTGSDWTIEFLFRPRASYGYPFDAWDTGARAVLLQYGRAVVSPEGSATHTGLLLTCDAEGVKLWDGETLRAINQRVNTNMGTGTDSYLDDPWYHVAIHSRAGKLAVLVDAAGDNGAYQLDGSFVASIGPGNYFTLGGEMLEFPDGSVRHGSDLFRYAKAETAQWRITVGACRHDGVTFNKSAVPKPPFPRG